MKHYHTGVANVCTIASYRWLRWISYIDIYIDIYWQLYCKVMTFSLNQATSFQPSAASTLKARVRLFQRPSGQTGQEAKCWLWGHGFKGEHLSKGGKLGPPQWAACDLSPQLCDFKSHASVSKHTCWKACWECSLVLSTHTGRFKLHLPNKIHLEERLAI